MASAFQAPGGIVGDRSPQGGRSRLGKNASFSFRAEAQGLSLVELSICGCVMDFGGMDIFRPQAGYFVGAPREAHTYVLVVDLPLSSGRKHRGPDPDRPRTCLLYTSPSPRDRTRSRMPS